MQALIGKILNLLFPDYLTHYVHLTKHCGKYRNFTKFPDVEILWKGKVSAQFRVIRSKLCGNYAFSQNFHTRKLGEITVFFVVKNEVFH